ncbi:hypothetical protein BH11BAC2_BH11BAC2_09050 [soil metagenome]
MKQLNSTGNFTESKQWKRLLPILMTGVSAGLTPVISLLVSLLVVRLYGAILWGDFIQEFLWMNLAAHLMVFGSKDLLLRNFSLDPSAAVIHWQSSIKSRTPFLFLLAMILVLAPISLIHGVWILGWIIFRFIYQSFEPAIIFRRKFHYTIIAEIAGGIFLIAAIGLWKTSLSTLMLIKIFTLAEVIKTVLMGLIQRNDFPLSISIGLDFTQLKLAAPFFLIGFTGLLHSRTDQLIATHFLPASQLAFYQIMMSILLMGQSVAYFIVQPYLQNLYRMSDETISKVALNLLIAGSILTPIMILFGSVLMHYCYHFEGDYTMMIYGFFFILPFFYSIPYIYALYKINEEKKVLLINSSVIVINILCLPYIFSTQSLSTVLLFNALLQILQAIVFRGLSKSIL